MFGAEPKFIDVDPKHFVLVLTKSRKIFHQTQKQFF